MERSTIAFTLFAIPCLFATGAFQGEFKGVTFIAQCPTRTRVDYFDQSAESLHEYVS